MSRPQDPLPLYLHLARASEQRRRPLVRDKMLVLAAVTAAERGLDLIAACCRRKVLSHNAGHLVSQYPSVAAALADERFQTYLRQLKRNYSVERAEHMLHSLGIQIAGERASYYSDQEYAAALLGTTPDALEAQFGDSSNYVEGADVRDSELVPREDSPRPLAEAAAPDRWQWIPGETRQPSFPWWIAAVGVLLLSLALLGVALVVFRS